MKVSSLIGSKVAHSTAPQITGEIKDILFGLSLSEVAFLLVDVTTPNGTAPVLFSPKVMEMGDDMMRISAHPDDVSARVDAWINRAPVAVNPTDLPSTFIGPFGNTFSPSMIAALFNARTDRDKPQPPNGTEGVWFSELEEYGVRAHVANVGQVADIILDDATENCQSIVIAAPNGTVRSTSPAAIKATRAPDNGLSLSLIQPD